jgi:hypothetical protein
MPGQAGDLVVQLRRPAQQIEHPGLLVLDHRVGLGDLAVELLLALGQPVDVPILGVGLFLKGVGLFLDGVELRRLLGVLLLGGGQSTFGPLECGPLLFDPLTGCLHPLLMGGDFRPHGDQLVVGRGDLLRQALGIGQQTGGFRFVLCDGRAPLVACLLRRAHRVHHGCDALGKPVILRHREARPQLSQPGIVFLEIPGLARLKFDAAQAFFDLFDDVRQPQQILLGAVELALGFLLAGPVLADARRLLENHPPLVRRRVQEHLHLALLDHRIGVGAHPGIHEHFADVPQPGRLTADGILAFAAAKQLAGDGHLVHVER